MIAALVVFPWVVGDMFAQSSSVVALPFSRIEKFCINYFSTMFAIVIGLMFYTVFGQYYIGIFNANWRPELHGFVASQVWKFSDVLTLAAYAYAVVLVPYYWFFVAVESKASIVFRWVIFRFVSGSVSHLPVQQAALSLLLKFIFVPFCINGLLGHFAVLNNEILAAIDSAGSRYEFFYLYSTIWHPLVMNLILVFDFVPFVVGYMVESAALKNRIHSVESSLVGWLVCLACYPPFNESVGRFLPWATRDFVPYALVGDQALFFAFNIALLVLFSAYASASVSLGFKCCNLCNRGVVSSGLYSVVRHPAYFLKNLAWWVAAVPVLNFMFSQSIARGLFGCFALASWTAIYAARAITEERHLLRTGSDYAVYMAKVRWRFIPFVI